MLWFFVWWHAHRLGAEIVLLVFIKDTTKRARSGRFEKRFCGSSALTFLCLRDSVAYDNDISDWWLRHESRLRAIGRPHAKTICDLHRGLRA